MKNFITQFSRVFVGILFIISGLIKLNDPVGFSFKLDEYFSEQVLNLPFLQPLALSIALFVVIFEVVLGLMLLVGYKPKFTVWSLLLMIVFFTFLTFYSAYFNKVTDCGCFGDALKLTPWESFTKDVVLLVFILILFVNHRLIRPLFDRASIVVALGLAGCAFMGYWVLSHLPLKDFRAYKVGTNIPQGMEVPEGAPQPVIEMTFIYKVNGEEKEFKVDELANLPEGAEFVDRRDNVISEGYIPPIHDFTMEKDGEDVAPQMLAEPKVLLFVMYDLKKADAGGLAKLESVYQKAKSAGYKVAAMTASVPEEIERVKREHKMTFDFYFCDATTLKTIERANPSLVVVKSGTIVQKLHHNDADDLNLN
jgi:uncharacterized membrane protein YphA (DoxX/SURF4 family)